MDNQTNHPRERSWQRAGYRDFTDMRDPPFKTGAADRSEQGSGRVVGSSAYLIGSLNLDDASTDAGQHRTGSLSLAASQATSRVNPTDTFLMFRSSSNEAVTSIGSSWLPVGQLPTLARGSTEAKVDTIPKYDALIRQVASLRERNDQLQSETFRKDVFRNNSMPSELSSSGSIRSNLPGSPAISGANRGAGLLASSQPAKEFMPAWGYDAVELDATMVLVLMDHQIVRLSPERLKTMQKEEYLRLLQKYKGMLEESCNTAQPGVNEGLQQELTGLIDEVTALTITITTCNPSLLQSVANGYTEWSAIIDMLNITDEQRQQLATMHHLYCCASQQLNDERQALLLSAMSGDRQQADGVSSPREATSTTASAALRELKMSEVCDKLRENVDRQNRNLRLLADGALRQVFSPLQTALFFIYSFPCVPDVLAMIQALQLPAMCKAKQSSTETDIKLQ